MTKRIKLTIFILFATLATEQCFGQCNPSYNSQNNCSNQTIQFYANAPGYTSYSWEFVEKTSGNQIRTSSDRDPYVVFPNAGNYTVKFNATGASGTCAKQFDIAIKQSSKIDVRRTSDTAQCFAKNIFCFKDFTIPATKIKRQIYEFSDGAHYDVDTPSFPYTFCHTFIDPKGGTFWLKVTSLDSNGCETIRRYTDFLTVYPEIKLSVTGNQPVRCDSAKATFTNQSKVGFDRLANFCWRFGDGTELCGDSIKNKDAWKGNGESFNHLYQRNGAYNLQLEVTTKKGCKASTVLKRAATVVKFTPQIITDNAIHRPGQAIKFKLKNGPIPGGMFLWNFGDPTSGIENVNNTSWTPTHSYRTLGPKMISLRVLHGPCDKMALDTVKIVGPQAIIEAPFNRIDENEKYQCGSKDTVYFTNNSMFWGNDSNALDEDSVVWAGGRYQYVFNYDATTRQGDQVSMSTNQHQSNRKFDHVSRLWDFGDAFANRCTTSTIENLNIGKNCNFSRDQFPSHKYPNWDSVYYYDYFQVNDTFTYSGLENGTCKTVLVDTASPALHRFVFYQTIPHNFTATLTLLDTVSGQVSQDEVTLISVKPNAHRMTIESGIPCPLDGNNLNYYLTFDLGTEGQSYFAVNYDSAHGADLFVASNSGGVLAPKAPGSPLPFVLPYDQVGERPSKFVKGYTEGELGNISIRQRDISIGLIVGNGQVGPNGEPPACLDTAWYHHLLHYDKINASFDIIGENGNNQVVCKAKPSYFKLKQERHNNIKHLRWDWGETNRLSAYFEEFHYLEKYTGPVSSRNDKDVVYNGEDWLFNYVVRHNFDDFYGDVILDTIVTRIVKDYWLEYVGETVLLNSSPGKFVQHVSNKELYKFIGTCIDTTGIGMNFEPRAYTLNSHEHVVQHGNKRYRYTNTNNSDSIEVAEVLHFRDSSLQGYDTLINGKDTTFGVWKHHYQKPIVTYKNNKKDTSFITVAGAMVPNLTLQSTIGCEKKAAKLLNVGHLAFMKLTQPAACKNQVVQIDDSIRYWQIGDNAFPNDYPIDPRRFWEDPRRYIQSTETKAIDWDARDGIGNQKERAISFFHQYDEPGEYTITLFTKDSVGCRDTVQVTVEITGLDADFRFDRNLSGNPCDKGVKFINTSTVQTTTNSDSVIWYDWDFGDNSQPSVLAQPSHTYKEYGTYKVRLKVFSYLGCIDSVIKDVRIEGPVPKFVFRDAPWHNVYDTATIYLKDTLYIINMSEEPVNDPKFRMNWGDRGVTTTNSRDKPFKHKYQQPGVYYPNLYMEDTIGGSANRCFAYFPAKPFENTPDSTIVVVVLHDSLNSIMGTNSQAYIYPNPSKGHVRIETLPQNVVESIDVTNLYGQSVSFTTVAKGTNTIELIVNDRVSSNYIITIKTQEGLIRKKLLVIR